MIKLTDNQQQFINILLTIGKWREPGFDKLKLTHRKDGRYQVSWQYKKKKEVPPYTVSDEQAFMYISYSEMRQVTTYLSRIIAEAGF